MFYLESYYNALTTPEIRIKIKLFGYICIRQNNIVIIRTVILRTKNTGGFVEYEYIIKENINITNTTTFITYDMFIEDYPNTSFQKNSASINVIDHHRNIAAGYEYVIWVIDLFRHYKFPPQYNF